MPDMLVRLYALPGGAPYQERALKAGLTLRRIEAWDRASLRRFVSSHFTENWASEADLAFAGGHPITGFVALERGAIAGFAVYDCSRRNFFGPTGIREDFRGSGAGAALLLLCLNAMRESGYAYAIIGGVGLAAFYERVCGATVIDGSDPGIYGDLYREARDSSSEASDAAHP
jgi:hypothetical protein